VRAAPRPRYQQGGRDDHERGPGEQPR